MGNLRDILDKEYKEYCIKAKVENEKEVDMKYKNIKDRLLKCAKEGELILNVLNSDLNSKVIDMLVSEGISVKSCRDQYYTVLSGWGKEG